MTRVVSAFVLIPVVVGTIWFLPSVATLLLAAAAGVLAFAEYRTIAQALGAEVPGVIGGTSVVLACVAMWSGPSLPTTGWDGPVVGPALVMPNEAYLVLLATLIVVGALAVGRGRPGPGVLTDAAATVFAPIYLGLPLGALAALTGQVGVLGAAAIVSPDGGRWVVLLLMAIIVISDSAQYYTGRAFGRRPLAPTISPKKTVEGAIGGVVFGTLATVAGGHYVFGSPLWIRALLGAAISLLGIVGDLFESLLKRSAGVKDSSNLIPGHGGVLDRIDSWLFAAPVYYVFVRFIA